MGCTSAKVINTRDTVLNMVTEKDKSYYKTLRPYLELDHHNNVNRVYNFMQKIHTDKNSG